MIKFNRLCRIMIKDMKTRISKLNIDFDFETYWEIIYLILLAFFVGMRFLLSSMFTIYWPKYFYRTLTVIGVVLVLLHLMMAKDISKKEIAAMLVVTFVFMMSHYVSGYDFLVDLLILIIGAYRVNFRNILKTYIAVWSVLLVVTIIGAMTGLAENLVYYQGERVRMALGICYPTDLAAYVASLIFTYVCVRDEYITYLEIGVMIVLAMAVYYITDARTDFVITLILVCLTMCMKLFLQKCGCFLKKCVKINAFSVPIVCCIISWVFTLLYNDKSKILVKMNEGFLSTRLSLGKNAIDNYGIRAFGQYIIEHGLGGSTEWPEFYNFIDCSYISLTLKYGIVVLITILIIIEKNIYRAYKKNDYMVILVLEIVCLQSIMEHHMIQYWYNPYIITLFCYWIKKNSVEENNDMIVNLN